MSIKKFVVVIASLDVSTVLFNIVYTLVSNWDMHKCLSKSMEIDFTREYKVIIHFENGETKRYEIVVIVKDISLYLNAVYFIGGFII